MAQTIETTLRVGSLLLRVVVVEKAYTLQRLFVVSVCLSVCPSVRPSVCLFVCQFHILFLEWCCIIACNNFRVSNTSSEDGEMLGQCTASQSSTTGTGK